jgi:hypothetical protein
MQRVTVKLTPDVARAFADPEGAPLLVQESVRHLLEMAPSFEATHPGFLDSDLGQWFTVDLDDIGLEHVLADLRTADGVEAAYIKPEAEAP